MASVSGSDAIAWMHAHSTNKPGYCLNTIWQAYGSHDSIGPHAGQYPTALDGWNYAERKHPGDATPPAGVPVYFGVSPTRTDSDAKAGDIVLSLGNGAVIGTDVGGAGRIGVTTITARAKAISRPYLGWTEDFLGYDVSFTTPAGESSTLINNTPTSTQEEDDMYSDADRTRDIIASNLIQNIKDTPLVQQGFKDAINKIYQGRLGRSADPSGLANYLGVLNQGQTIGYVDKAILASAEYKQKHPNG